MEGSGRAANGSQARSPQRSGRGLATDAVGARSKAGRNDSAFPTRGRSARLARCNPFRPKQYPYDVGSILIDGPFKALSVGFKTYLGKSIRSQLFTVGLAISTND